MHGFNFCLSQKAPLGKAMRRSLQGATLPHQALHKATRAGWNDCIPRRWASLSAIHHGRRREERSRAQGSRASRQSSGDGAAAETSQRLTFAERHRARESATRPAFRIRKGKKDITHKDGPRPLSRQARFYDPEDSFGKKSLVYQAKTGRLQEQLRALDDISTTSKGSALPRSRNAISKRTGNGTGDTGGARHTEKIGAEDSNRGRTSWDALVAYSEESKARQGGNERRLRTREGRNTRRTEDLLQNPATERQPLSIPYTTAASQFLYGKSVVEAALRASRRKLYKLYVYGGAHRQNVSQDLAVQRLAERRGVDVQVVGEDGLRLLDKMSAGRPHNGYVLEASPLPQLPLTGLGPISEDESHPGFSVNLAHQSAEDAKINGTSSFIPCPRSDHRPLVIVLDQILDPGNLGAILRTASFLGATAVAATKRNSATLTPVALKASAGASEALTLFSVESLADFLTESKESGWRVYAAAPATGRSRQNRQVDIHEIGELDPLSKDPCILLIGSEGEGLSKQLRSKADFVLSIPNLSGSTVVDSLNVSVATGLLCSAFLQGKQRSQFAKLEDKLGEPGLW